MDCRACENDPKSLGNEDERSDDAKSVHIGEKSPDNDIVSETIDISVVEVANDCEITSITDPVETTLTILCAQNDNEEDTNPHNNETNNLTHIEVDPEQLPGQISSNDILVGVLQDDNDSLNVEKEAGEIEPRALSSNDSIKCNDAGANISQSNKDIKSTSSDCPEVKIISNTNILPTSTPPKSLLRFEKTQISPRSEKIVKAAKEPNEMLEKNVNKLSLAKTETDGTNNVDNDLSKKSEVISSRSHSMSKMIISQGKEIDDQSQKSNYTSLSTDLSEPCSSNKLPSVTKQLSQDMLKNTVTVPASDCLNLEDLSDISDASIASDGYAVEVGQEEDQDGVLEYKIEKSPKLDPQDEKMGSELIDVRDSSLSETNTGNENLNISNTKNIPSDSSELGTMCELSIGSKCIVSKSGSSDDSVELQSEEKCTDATLTLQNKDISCEMNVSSNDYVSESHTPSSSSTIANSTKSSDCSLNLKTVEISDVSVHCVHNTVNDLATDAPSLKSCNSEATTISQSPKLQIQGKMSSDNNTEEQTVRYEKGDKVSNTALPPNLDKDICDKVSDISNSPNHSPAIIVEESKEIDENPFVLVDSCQDSLLSNKTSDQSSNLESPEETKTLSEETKTIAEDTKTLAEETKTVAEETKTVAEDTKTLAEETITVAEETKTLAEDTKTLAEDTKPLAEDTKTLAEDTKTLAEETKPVAEETKTLAEETKTLASVRSQKICEIALKSIDEDEKLSSQCEENTPSNVLSNDTVIKNSCSTGTPDKSSSSVHVEESFSPTNKSSLKSTLTKDKAKSCEVISPTKSSVSVRSLLLRGMASKSLNASEGINLPSEKDSPKKSPIVGSGFPRIVLREKSNKARKIRKLNLTEKSADDQVTVSPKGDKDSKKSEVCKKISGNRSPIKRSSAVEEKSDSLSPEISPMSKKLLLKNAEVCLVKIQESVLMKYGVSFNNISNTEIKENTRNTPVLNEELKENADVDLKQRIGKRKFTQSCEEEQATEGGRRVKKTKIVVKSKKQPNETRTKKISSRKASRANSNQNCSDIDKDSLTQVLNATNVISSSTLVSQDKKNNTDFSPRLNMLSKCNELNIKKVQVHVTKLDNSILSKYGVHENDSKMTVISASDKESEKHVSLKKDELKIIKNVAEKKQRKKVKHVRPVKDLTKNASSLVRDRYTENIEDKIITTDSSVSILRKVKIKESTEPLANPIEDETDGNTSREKKSISEPVEKNDKVKGSPNKLRSVRRKNNTNMNEQKGKCEEDNRVFSPSYIGNPTEKDEDSGKDFESNALDESMRLESSPKHSSKRVSNLLQEGDQDLDGKPLTPEITPEITPTKNPAFELKVAVVCLSKIDKDELTKHGISIDQLFAKKVNDSKSSKTKCMHVSKEKNSVSLKSILSRRLEGTQSSENSSETRKRKRNVSFDLSESLQKDTESPPMKMFKPDNIT